MRLSKAAIARLQDHKEASFANGDRQHATDLQMLLNFYNEKVKEEEREAKTNKSKSAT